jgi:hypothetical protein
MFCCNRSFGVLRSLVCLALLGVAVIVLIGPVLAILGVLLPFAIIGALAWAGYRLFQVVFRRERSRQRALVLLKDDPPARPTPPSVVLAPAPVVAVAEKRPVPHRPSRLRSLARSAFHVAVEVGCGAAVGGALAVVAWQSGAAMQSGAAIEQQVALGAAIGAVVGFVVGGSRPAQAGEEAGDPAKSASQAA